MSQAQMEKLIGVVDGANKDFFTPTPYTPGKIRLILNGQVIADKDHDNGFIETDPATGQVTFKIAPRSTFDGDTPWAWYVDTSPVLPETDVIGLVTEVELTENINTVVELTDDVVRTIILSDNVEIDVDLLEDIDVTIETTRISVDVEVCE